MPSIIDKMKDKLHIGKDRDDSISAATYNKHGSTSEHAGAKGSQSGLHSGASGTSSTHSGTGIGSGVGTATGAGVGAGAGTPTSGVPQTGSNAGSAGVRTPTGSSSGVGGSAGTGSGAAQQAVETVVIHERDPNWGKARELTTGAEQASKVSAAKAYEAESFLISAQDAHKAAQEHVNLQAELAAQAEAEKRNIGAVDTLHREVDHYKNVIEEKESIHREFNKGLGERRGLVQAKEGELGSIMPVASDRAREVESIQNQLGNLQGAKLDLERKAYQQQNHLAEIEAEVGQVQSQLRGLEGEVERLNARALELEQAAKQARAAATERSAILQEYRGRTKELMADADRTSKSVQMAQRELDGFRAKENELVANLERTRGAAQEAANLAAAKQAELQLAKQQYDMERQKGLPMEQDIERYHKSVQEKERELVEAQETSKSAKLAYEKFSAEAAQHAKEVERLEALKEEKFVGYKQRKKESDVANSRATAMWEEAKKYGNTGDANALQRLAEAEKEFMEVSQDVALPLVTPNVGMKQPTTEGPKIHRTEKAAEKNDEVSRENVQTRYA